MKSTFVLLLALWLCASGCGKEVEGTPGTNEVWLEYKLIRPAQLIVVTGTTVKFINKGNPSHTVQGTLFYSGKIKSGETYEYTFTVPGTYYFTCGYHSSNASEQVAIQVQ
jgi:plastocyanin